MLSWQDNLDTSFSSVNGSSVSAAVVPVLLSDTAQRQRIDRIRTDLSRVSLRDASIVTHGDDDIPARRGEKFATEPPVNSRQRKNVLNESVASAMSSDAENPWAFAIRNLIDETQAAMHTVNEQQHTLTNTIATLQSALDAAEHDRSRLERILRERDAQISDLLAKQAAAHISFSQTSDKSEAIGDKSKSTTAKSDTSHLKELQEAQQTISALEERISRVEQERKSVLAELSAAREIAAKADTSIRQLEENAKTKEMQHHAALASLEATCAAGVERERTLINQVDALLKELEILTKSYNDACEACAVVRQNAISLETALAAERAKRTDDEKREALLLQLRQDISALQEAAARVTLPREANKSTRIYFKPPPHALIRDKTRLKRRRPHTFVPTTPQHSASAHRALDSDAAKEASITAEAVDSRAPTPMMAQPAQIIRRNVASPEAFPPQIAAHSTPPNPMEESITAAATPDASIFNTLSAIRSLLGPDVHSQM